MLSITHPWVMNSIQTALGLNLLLISWVTEWHQPVLCASVCSGIKWGQSQCCLRESAGGLRDNPCTLSVWRWYTATPAAALLVLQSLGKTLPGSQVSGSPSWLCQRPVISSTSPACPTAMFPEHRASALASGPRNSCWTALYVVGCAAASALPCP